MAKQLKKPSFFMARVLIFLLFLMVMGLSFATISFATIGTSHKLMFIYFPCQAFLIAWTCLGCVLYLKKYVDYKFQELEKENS